MLTTLQGSKHTCAVLASRTDLSLCPDPASTGERSLEVEMFQVREYHKSRNPIFTEAVK